MILAKKDQDFRFCNSLSKQTDTLKEFFCELEASKDDCISFFGDTDPCKNELHKTDPELMEKAQEIKYFKEIVIEHNEQANKYIDIYYSRLLQQIEIDYKLLNAKLNYGKTLALVQKNDVDCRKHILKCMNYIDDREFKIKGKIACLLYKYSNQTYSADELLMTELFHNGVFQKLELSQLVAMLSLFVRHDESDGIPVNNYERTIHLGRMVLNKTEFRLLARQIAKECNNDELLVNEDTYEDRYQPFFMYICHEWCRGASFHQICQMTFMTEECIVFVMTMLIQIMKRFLHVSNYTGNIDLAKKFQKAIRLVERDFVLAACKTPLL